MGIMVHTNNHPGGIGVFGSLLLQDAR